MNPVTTTTLPLARQFVVVYPGLDGGAYSATLKWVDGKLSSYDGFKDEWVSTWSYGYSVAFLQSLKATYILL